MRDLLSTLEQWLLAGHRFAIATVTQTWGSSPRPVGAIMGIRDDGHLCGSVSGGCVESAVIEKAIESLDSGQPCELRFEAATEDSIWDVGLSCGGRIQIRIEPDPSVRDSRSWNLLADLVKQDKPLVLVSDYDQASTSIWTPGDPDPLNGEIEAAYASRSSGEILVEGKRIFLNVVANREKIVIIGSVHIAVPLVGFAKALGFETVVIDPRQGFASRERYPTEPDRIIMEWPEPALSSIALNGETYAVVLTHDPKIDDVALEILLRSSVAYIGALGSRTTQSKRRDSLRAKGFSDEVLDRIHGPIGINIGAKSPEEIALSIVAEIIQVRRSSR